MSLDLMLGKTKRSWNRGFIPESLGSDPLVWTPSAVKAELDRVRDLLDVVNQEMSWALEDKKLTGAEWSQWSQTYKSVHRFTNKASSLWGSNVLVARQHEREIQKWRDLLQKRGARQAGPGDLGRPPGELGLSALLVPLLAGAAATLGIVLYLGKKKNLTLRSRPV